MLNLIFSATPKFDVFLAAEMGYNLIALSRCLCRTFSCNANELFLDITLYKCLSWADAMLLNAY